MSMGQTRFARFTRCREQVLLRMPLFTPTCQVKRDVKRGHEVALTSS
jgi:hypothetical protein